MQNNRGGLYLLIGAICIAALFFFFDGGDSKPSDADIDRTLEEINSKSTHWEVKRAEKTEGGPIRFVEGIPSESTGQRRARLCWGYKDEPENTPMRCGSVRLYNDVMKDIFSLNSESSDKQWGVSYVD